MASAIFVTSHTSLRIGPQRLTRSCGGCRFNAEGISLRLPTKSKMCQYNFSLASADQRKYLKTSPRSEGQRESTTLMCSSVPFFPLMVLAYLCTSSSTRAGTLRKWMPQWNLETTIKQGNQEAWISAQDILNHRNTAVALFLKLEHLFYLQSALRNRNRIHILNTYVSSWTW